MNELWFWTFLFFYFLFEFENTFNVDRLKSILIFLLLYIFLHSKVSTKVFYILFFESQSDVVGGGVQICVFIIFCCEKMSYSRFFRGNDVWSYFFFFF